MVLNEEQKNAFFKIKNFLKSNNKIFILKGYAGTGKTTLLKRLIAYNKNKYNFILLASTGLASKVLSEKTNSKTSTIHNQIYKFKKIEELKDEYNYNFVIKNQNSSLTKIDVCIVDEASMIGNEYIDKETRVFFGTEKLLQDFLNANENSKIIFVGDSMQLPPIESNTSVALDKEYLEKLFNLKCEEVILKTIVRQNENNLVKTESIRLRECFENNKNFEVNIDNKNILEIKYNEIPNYYIKNKNTGIITYSNKTALIISKAIRNKLFEDSTKKINKDEKLLVIFNNHKLGIMNGNLIYVSKVLEKKCFDVNLEYKNKNENRIIKLEFIKAVVKEESKKSIETWILLNFLDDLFYPKDEIYISDALTKLSKENKNLDYFNALRVRYGYAITCHKAQGSEFDNVILEKVNNDYKWLYTGMTRTKNKLLLFETNNDYFALNEKKENIIQNNYINKTILKVKLNMKKNNILNTKKYHFKIKL